MAKLGKKFQVPRHAITEQGLKKLLKQASKDHSSLGAWGEAHKILPQTVSAFMRKVQGPGLQIPEALGYRPQIIFIPLDKPLIQTPNPSRRPTDRPTKKTDQSREPLEKKDLRKKDDRKETKKRLKKKAKK